MASVPNNANANGNASTSGLASPFVAALENFKKKMKKGTRDLGLITIEDLEKQIDAIQTEQHHRRTLKNFGRLRAFLEAAEEFGKVIEVYCQVHEIVAFIWGPLKLLLQIARAHVEVIDELVGVYQNLGGTMRLLQQSWDLHPRDAHLGSALAEVYECILGFHYKALHYFNQPNWQRAFAASWKTHKATFGEIIEAMKDHQNVIMRHTSIAEYRSNRENREKRTAEQRDDANEQHFRELRTWLQGADFEDDHDTLRRAQIPGTGRWLFDNAQFKKWFDPMSTYSLLWMNGLPGAGKSVLASMVVEEINHIARSRNSQYRCLYFYCKEGDGERDNFVAIGRSLLLQLLTHEPQMVAYPYSVYRKSKQTILRTRLVVEDLLEKALLACPSVYIVLDGIDECAQEERQGLVQWFKKLVEKLHPTTSNRLRVLFVSQSNTRERRDFSGITSLKIQADDNKSDVATFARIEAAKIQDKFGITDQDRVGISDRIPESCGGIFLLATLICKHLSGHLTLEDLEAELKFKDFPRDINEAYERIMKRILRDCQSAKEREYCFMLFGWLVCAKRPLKWHEIQGAKSLDLENQRVDLQRKRFVLGAKEICGALIEHHHDGSIKFIHITARWFLTEGKYVNMYDEHVKLTQLCISYLNLPALCKSATAIDENIRSGYYSFMDYAISNWVLHLEEATKSDDSEAKEALSDISESLGVFLDEHWAKPPKLVPVADRHIAKLKPFQSETFYKKLESAFGWGRKMVYSHTSIPSSEIVLDLLDVLTMVRLRIERVWDESQRNDDEHIGMEQKYGKDIFKCPRLSCLHFTQGFSSRVLRDDHLKKHERPYRCTLDGCLNSMLGFSKSADLQKHMEQAHDSLGDDPNNQFPVQNEKKRAPAPPKSQPRPQGPASSNTNQNTTSTSPGSSSHIPTSQQGSSLQSPGEGVLPTQLDIEMEGTTEEEYATGPQLDPPSPNTPEPESPPERPAKMQKISGPKTFECIECARTFNKKFNYDSHMRIHSKDKPFSCSYCQRAFARESDCTRHETSHQRDRRYRCGGCQKLFARLDTMQGHWRRPCGERCLEAMNEYSNAGSYLDALPAEGHFEAVLPTHLSGAAD